MPGAFTAALEPVSDGVSIKIYVAPRSSSNRVVGLHNGALKVSLTAPPVDGAANRALVDFLARLFGVARAKVYITSGEASRNKTVVVAGLDVPTVARKLSEIPGLH